MIVGIFSMFVLVLYMLSGGVPTGKEGLTTVFYSPAFIISCFVMCFSIIYVCFTQYTTKEKFSKFSIITAITAGALAVFSPFVYMLLKAYVPWGVYNYSHSEVFLFTLRTVFWVAYLGYALCIFVVRLYHVRKQLINPLEWHKLLFAKRVSFFLSHASIVIICVGCLIGMFLSKKTEMMLYVGPDFYYEQVPFEKHDEKLGFGIGAAAFRLEKYPMKEIDLFVMKEIPTPENMRRMGHPGQTVKDYVFEKSFNVADGDIKFENGTVVKLSDLKVEGGDDWVAQYPVEGIGVLQPAPQMDKFYEVDFKIITKAEKEDEEDTSEIVRMEVNRPVSHNGWKFYLLDYDKRDHRHVWISARKDPGAIFVVVGCWLLMIGTSMMCFGAPTLKGGKDES